MKHHLAMLSFINNINFYYIDNYLYFFYSLQDYLKYYQQLLVFLQMKNFQF